MLGLGKRRGLGRQELEVRKMAGKTIVLKAFLTGLLLVLSHEVTALKCVSPGVSCDFPIAEYRFEGNLRNSSAFSFDFDAQNTAFQPPESYIYGFEGNMSYSYIGFTPYNAIEFRPCLFRHKDIAIEWNIYVDKKAVLESSDSKNIIWRVDLGYRQGESEPKKAEVYIEKDPRNSANLQIVFMYPRLTGVSYLKAGDISSDGWYNIKIGWKNAAGISSESGSEIMLDVYDYDYYDGVLGDDYSCSEIWYREIDLGTETRGDETAYMGGGPGAGENSLRLKVDDVVFWNCYLYEINPTPTHITDVTPRPTIIFQMTPTPHETNIPAPADTEVNTQTPTETYTETPTETYTETPTETYTETPTETYTETPTETYTETPTETYTETPTETYTETPTETYAVIPTETREPLISPTLIATQTVTESAGCRISYKIKIGKMEYGRGQLKKNPGLAAVIVRALELEELLYAGEKKKKRLKMEITKSEDGVFEYAIRARNIEIVITDGAGCLYDSAAEFNNEGRVREKAEKWLERIERAGEEIELLISGNKGRGVVSGASWETREVRYDFDAENCYNFPNPFRDETTVRFAVPRDAMAEILVYDASGVAVYRVRIMAVAGVNNVMLKALDYNDRNLPSGVYVMKVIFENETVTKKIVIMR